MFSLSTITGLRSNALRLSAALITAVLPLAVRVAPASADALALDVRPPVAPYVLPYAILDGAPDMSAGEGMGYWLWSDDAGLHLRTTTHGLPHVFRGVLRTRESASFTDVSDVRLEERDWNHDREVQVDNDTIRFRFVTYDGTDGIDFKLDGGIFCVELENNGHEAIAATHLGAEQVRPAAMPVCFKR